jgi:2-iminobutanoate/2-iminopropanoate deaminase
MRVSINPDGLPAVNSTYSQAIQAGGFVFVSGQTGINPATGRLVSDDIAEQAAQALENLAPFFGPRVRHSKRWCR